MRMLDLFSGLGGAVAPFRDRGHEVVTTDLEARFGCIVTGDIMDPHVVARLKELGPYDFVWASPPCEAFSVAAIGHHWSPGYVPKTEHAVLSKRIVEHTLALIDTLSPRFWAMENPRGMLRKMPFMADLNRVTVTYCGYGDTRMKPTDLWGHFPPMMFRPMCSNGADCHESAPRGSRTGTQGMANAADRAVVPYLLAEEFCIAIEEALEAT